MIRKILYAVVFVLMVYFVATNWEEVLLIIKAFGQADTIWLLTAVAVQFIWLIVIAFMGRACFRMVGIDETIPHLISLLAAANFVNVVAPSYGAGAIAVIMYDGHQRGNPPARVLTASFLYLVYDYAVILILMIPGLYILARQDALGTVILGAALFVIAVGITMFTLTYLGIRKADQLGQAVSGFVQRLNSLLEPLLHRDFINPPRAEKFANDLAEGLKHVQRNPRAVFIPLGYSFIRQLLMMLILFIVSLAFHHPFDLATTLSSFIVSILFTIASVTPSGVGFVEGAMGITQTAFGVDPVSSAAIAIVYRGVTFWLVLFYGFFAIRWVGYTIQNAVNGKNGSENGARLSDDQEQELIGIPSSSQTTEESPPKSTVEAHISPSNSRKS